MLRAWSSFFSRVFLASFFIASFFPLSSSQVPQIWINARPKKEVVKSFAKLTQKDAILDNAINIIDGSAFQYWRVKPLKELMMQSDNA